MIVNTTIVNNGGSDVVVSEFVNKGSQSIIITDAIGKQNLILTPTYDSGTINTSYQAINMQGIIGVTILNDSVKSVLFTNSKSGSYLTVEELKEGTTWSSSTGTLSFSSRYLNPYVKFTVVAW